MAQQPAEPPTPSATPDLQQTGERIDALIEGLASPGPVPNTGRAREQAEELVRVVTNLYGAGLERLLDIAYDSGKLDEELLTRLADDDLVASLLLVHGLHPLSMQERVERALESVRPYLGSHGGDVELLDVSEAGVVQLRLLGSCDGCPSSSVTLKLAVEDAILSAAPEIESIEVQTPTETGGTTLIPVGALRTRLDPDGQDSEAAAWRSLAEAAELAPGAATVLGVDGRALYVCRIGGDLFAFDDRCGQCESSLRGAMPVRRLGAAAGECVLTCPRCGSHFDVRHAGAGLDRPEVHLNPLPLLVRDGTVSVALPASAPVPAVR